MPDPASRTDSVHATCIALGEAGLLIRGPSGAGKSTLALLLLDRASVMDWPASLVADDRVRLSRDGATLVAHANPDLADPELGDRIEVRGLGLLRATEILSAVPVRLVVDLVADAPRLPEGPLSRTALLGLDLPALRLDAPLLRAGLGPRLVLDALAECHGVASGTHRPVLRLPPLPRP
ncbi:MULTISPECIES: HPr kinase/phosphorylase [Methylobacterium]|uniref:HPr kinase/phosphorylase n=1 Tax=Methylobacterium TaxID=407 RepID=UPI0009E77863|nr:MULTISPECIES: HPr kinase/phosphatase C-terminal domain-containing protein [Methylobacterium]MCI9878965.1 HPr kinase/phosphatase C-terminal domain-containing protein [Methylobacterium goesingense]